MKSKRFITTLLICIIMGSLFSFSACKESTSQDGTYKTISILVLTIDSESIFDKELSTNKTSFYDALGECDELEISAKYSFAGAYLLGIAVGVVEDSEFGKTFIKSAEIKEEGIYPSGTYISIYHDIEKDELRDLSGFMSDLDYQDNAYYPSGLGVSSLPIVDGHTYVLKLSSF